jgi:ActR/RegA family two-component response regulator
MRADGPPSADGAPPAILCTDDEYLARAIRPLLAEAGFHLIGEVTRGLDAVPLAAQHRPAVAVLDLTVAGTLGLRLIQILEVAAPGCRVLAVSPLASLAAAAREAGAAVVASPDDLRGLRVALAETPDSAVG